MRYENLDRISFIKKVKRMPDKDFLILYKKGLSDGAIGKIYGITHGVVRNRRQKFGLVANFIGPRGRLNSEESKASYKKWNDYRSKKGNERVKNNQERKKNMNVAHKNSRLRNLKKYRDREIRYNKNPKRIKYNKEYKEREKTKEHIKEYNASSERKIQRNKLAKEIRTSRSIIGLCIICGKVKERKDTKSCNKCLKYNKDLQQKLRDKLKNSISFAKLNRRNLRIKIR